MYRIENYLIYKKKQLFFITTEMKLWEFILFEVTKKKMFSYIDISKRKEQNKQAKENT